MHKYLAILILLFIHSNIYAKTSMSKEECKTLQAQGSITPDYCKTLSPPPQAGFYLSSFLPPAPGNYTDTIEYALVLFPSKKYCFHSYHGFSGKKVQYAEGKWQRDVSNYVRLDNGIIVKPFMQEQGKHFYLINNTLLAYQDINRLKGDNNSSEKETWQSLRQEVCNR